MALHKNTRFQLVEFDDGIQVVPDDWIQKDINECWYPNYNTDKDISKAIKKRQTPQDDWLSYPIKRVFGTYESYNEARNKLRKAEMNSDINTDTDDKAQRRIRARKAINSDHESDIESDSSDDEICLPPYPKAPMVYTNKKPIQKETTKSQHYVSDNRSSSKASFSHKSMSIEQRRHYDVGLCDREIMDNTSKNRTIPAGSSASNIREGSTETISKTEEYIKINDYLQRILRMLADIKFDINHLTEQHQVINNKLNSNIDNRAREYRSPTPNDELSKLSFPLQTTQEIELLQRILTSNEEGIKEHMLSILASIGGSSYEEMSKRMFIFIFTNEVASSYSWVGGKGKLKLYNLEIMKLMFKVVKKTFPNITEKDFEIKCKDWFRHAKHRSENEKRRQNNSTQQ